MPTYGVENNEHATKKYLDYAHNQGLIPQKYNYDELFVPSTPDTERPDDLEEQGATIQI